MLKTNNQASDDRRPLQADNVATSWRVIEGFSTGLVIETRSVPALARCYPCSFTLITRTARCLRQLPSWVAVYPRDPQSRRVDAPLAQLRTATLRGLTVDPSASQPDVFYVADPISSIRAVTTANGTEPSSSIASEW
jgi:hypothetical protein